MIPCPHWTGEKMEGRDRKTGGETSCVQRDRGRAEVHKKEGTSVSISPVRGLFFLLYTLCPPGAAAAEAADLDSWVFEGAGSRGVVPFKELSRIDTILMIIGSNDQIRFGSESFKFTHPLYWWELLSKFSNIGSNLNCTHQSRYKCISVSTRSRMPHLQPVGAAAAAVISDQRGEEKV